MNDTRTQVLLINRDDSNKTTWLPLPFDEADWTEALERIEVQEEENDENVDLYDLVVSGQPINSNGYIVSTWTSDFDGFTKKNLENVFAFSDLVERIEDLEENDLKAVEALIEDGDSIEQALDELEDGDVDFYPNIDLPTLAEQFGDEEYFSKEYLLQHIDWESVARDLENDGGYHEVAGGVLFRSR